MERPDPLVRTTDRDLIDASPIGAGLVTQPKRTTFPPRWPPPELIDYFVDLTLPDFNEYRAALGWDPEPPRAGPPITLEQAVKASKEAWEWEAFLRGDDNPQFKRKPQVKRKPARPARIRPPDGLRTRAEAAAKIGCSLKTLDGHVETGALRYVALGRGRKRVRRMFTDADLEQFIANQTRKDVPCPSIAVDARRSGNLTSSSEVVAFSGLPKPRRGAKPKP
jgi:hypothetical protein